MLITDLDNFCKTFTQMCDANIFPLELFKFCKSLNNGGFNEWIITIIVHICDMKNINYINTLFDLCLCDAIRPSDIITGVNAALCGRGIRMFIMYYHKSGSRITQKNLCSLQEEISDGDVIEYDGTLEYIYQLGLKIDDTDNKYVKPFIDRLFI
jgi:hypothetical protein